MSAKLSALSAVSSPQATDLIYTVRPVDGAGGSHQITNDNLFSIITANITDGAVRFRGFAAPSLSAAGQGAIYFDTTLNRFQISETAGAFAGLQTVNSAGVLILPDNVRQTFNPGATVAGLNTGALAGDPSTVINGDLWYDSTGNLLRARINGASVSLGPSIPGGSNTQVQFNNAGAFGGISGVTSDGTNVTAGDGNLRATSPLITTSIDDVNGNVIIGLSPAASAVNQYNIANSAAGTSPILSVIGADTNLSIFLLPKGTGGLRLFNAADTLQFFEAVNILPGANFPRTLFQGGRSTSDSNWLMRFADAYSSSALNINAGIQLSTNNDSGFTNAETLSMLTGAAVHGLFSFSGSGSNGLPIAITTNANGGADTTPNLYLDTVANGQRVGIRTNAPTGQLDVLTAGGARVVIATDANTYFGNGIVNAAPASYILNATGGSGTNIAGADLYLAGGKGTGNAAQGLAAFRYPLTGASGTTLQSLSTASFPPWVNMFIRNDGNVTVANTTVETSILGAAQAGSTKTIEAGLGRVGRTFWLRIWGNISTTGTPTIQFRLKFGTTTIVDLGAVTMANNTVVASRNFYLEAVVSVRSVGATGVVHVFPFRFSYNVSTGGAVNQASQAGAPTVDMTVAQTFDVTAQWSVADPSNSVDAAQSLIDMTR